MVMQYDQHCAGCQRAQGLHSIPGAVIGLPGDWSVSHYAGGEGFLGVARASTALPPSSPVQEPSANSSSARAVARPGWMAGKLRGLHRVERSLSDTVRSRQCGPNESHNSWSTYGMSCHPRLRLTSVRAV